MEQIADATWPRMALRHFALGLATKKRKMIKKSRFYACPAIEFSKPKWNLLSWLYGSR